MLNSWHFWLGVGIVIGFTMGYLLL